MNYNKQEILTELLVIRWQKGDSDASFELVKNWEKPLGYYVRRMLGDGPEQWDVQQEVWLRVFRGLSSLRDPATFRVWLYRIAHRTVMRHLREKYVEPPIESIADQSLEIAVADQEETLLEDVEAIHHALTCLPIAYREILTLQFLEGMSVQRIAEIIGIPIGTVKSRLFNARQALREIFEKGDEK